MAVNGMYKLMEQFAVHDGPGMRLIVFLKGCNLRCKWCQNPECIEYKPQLWYNKLRCKDEGQCVEVCSEGAISMDKDNKFDLEKCNDCFKCADVCRPGAFEVIGREISSDDLVKQILKYKFFFSRSKDGGVTISGGEPTFQSEFTADVLSQLKKEGINIDYIYPCLTRRGTESTAVLILGVASQDRERSLAVLKENWIKVLNEELYRL